MCVTMCAFFFLGKAAAHSFAQILGGVHDLHGLRIIGLKGSRQSPFLKYKVPCYLTSVVPAVTSQYLTEHLLSQAFLYY